MENEFSLSSVIYQISRVLVKDERAPLDIRVASATMLVTEASRNILEHVKGTPIITTEQQSRLLEQCLDFVDRVNAVLNAPANQDIDHSPVDNQPIKIVFDESNIE